MTQVELRAAPPGSAIGWWRVRERPAGPAGALSVRLTGAVTIRVDRSDPAVLLDLEAIAVAEEHMLQVRALATALWGPEVGAGLGDVGAFTASIDNDAPRAAIVELVALAALVEHSLPTLCSIDVARQAEAVASQCGDEDLRRLVRHFGTTHAARAAHAWDRLPSSEVLGLDPPQVALVVAAGRAVDDLMGGNRSVAAPARPQSGPTAAKVASLLRVERIGAHRGRASREQPVTLDDEHLGFVVSGCVIEQRKEIATLSGRWRPLDTDDSPPPVAWARAFTPGGALIYAGRCEFEGDTFSAELVVAGEVGEDFLLDLTTDLLADQWSGTRGDAARAQMLAAAAANLQTTAGDSEEWGVVAALWERSAALWGTSGDQARRTLGLVQALRAYRAAGPRYAVRIESLEHAATLALTRLDPRWSPPDPGAAATADPHQLRRLLTTAGLATPIDRWVRQQLDAITATLRDPGQRDADHRHLVRRIEDLEAATAGDRVGTARMNARVALARWAAGSGRRRMALLVLFPLVIRYDELDATGRREFAETQALLIGPVSEPDPDGTGESSGEPAP